MRATFLCLACLPALVAMVWQRGIAAPPSDMERAGRSINAFGADLYAKLDRGAGNSFFSPASIAAALGMTYAGARGPTASEMAATLHLPQDKQSASAALGALFHKLDGSGEKRAYQLSIANALWAQQGYAFLPEFLAQTKQGYGAAVREVDFVGATEGARNTINGWVEKQTHDKIKELLPRGSVDGNSRLVLTNAIYFKGTWAVPFNKNLTGPAPFHVGKEKQVSVPLMHETATFGYLDGSTFQALEMQYKGNDLSMVVLLPNQVDGLSDLEKQLTAERLADWLGKLRGREVIVSLPRFKMTAEYRLKETLSALGMPLAFSGEADFSGMDGKKDLFLSEVFHKAFVDVNEEGTEAAAATGAVMALGRAVRSRPVVFQADHPFVFLIRDRKSGAILFMGRLEEPRT